MAQKSAKSQTIDLKILGSKISLRTSETDPERIQQIVTLVSGRLKDVEKRAPSGIAPHQLILLALLDLAEDYLNAKNKTSDFKKTVEARSTELLNLLEAELK